MATTCPPQHHRLSFPAAAFEDVDAAVEWCERWLRMRNGPRPAAVFDIDSTLVYEDQRIEPVCQLYEACRRLGVTPFLVTARAEAGRSFTEDQMRRLGIEGYKRLYMHPPSLKCDTHGAGRAKAHARRRIEAHDFSIVLNAGDAHHDHFFPTPTDLRGALDSRGIHVFLTGDGVAHLKLPG